MLRFLMKGSRRRRFDSAVRLLVGEFEYDWRRMTEKNLTHYVLEPVCLGYILGFTRGVVHAHYLETVFRAAEATVTELAGPEVGHRTVDEIKALLSPASSWHKVFEQSLSLGEDDAKRCLRRSPSYTGTKLSQYAEMLDFAKRQIEGSS